MSSPAQAIAEYLAAHSVGTLAGTAEWGIYIAKEPATPFPTITIYDYSGEEPDTDDLSIIYPRFQVRTRHDSYDTCYQKQEQIRDLLIVTDGIAGFISIQMQTDIMPLGTDDNKKHLLVSSYRTMRNRT